MLEFSLNFAGTLYQGAADTDTCERMQQKIAMDKMIIEHQRDSLDILNGTAHDDAQHQIREAEKRVAELEEALKTCTHGPTPTSGPDSDFCRSLEETIKTRDELSKTLAKRLKPKGTMTEAARKQIMKEMRNSDIKASKARRKHLALCVQK